jgi:hypothetical protein
MSKIDPLRVTTHVARGFLHSAELFRHPERVVWEYVVNGLEYTDPGVAPVVTVTVDTNPRRIRIADNGRGMDREGLAQFFTLHAENLDRAAGRPGRGYFGTGKSAAFAIANVLKLDTVRNGRHSVVELRRPDIENVKSAEAVPVRELEIESLTDRPNGTVVTISDFRISKLSRSDIIRFIERNLRHIGRGMKVVVDGVEVEPHVPPIAFSRTYTIDLSSFSGLGSSELTLHVSKAPLLEDDRGVAILSNGTLHETTLGTARGKPMSQYIFGEIDVAALSSPHKGIAAYDMSRSGQLNPENEMVLFLQAEISRYVEVLRQELVEQENARRRAEESEKLQSQADEIARLINEDFLETSKRFRRARAEVLAGEDMRLAQRIADLGEPSFLPDGDEPAIFGADQIIIDSNSERLIGPDPREPEVRVEPSPLEEAETTGHSESTKPSKKHPSGGGFKVRYRENGMEAPRAFYEAETRTIYINLDHPQVLAAKADGDTEDPTFRRLSYEIAFTEYAIGFAQEYADNKYYSDFDEPLFDIRDRIDKLARRASDVFRPGL